MWNFSKTNYENVKRIQLAQEFISVRCPILLFPTFGTRSSASGTVAIENCESNVESYVVQENGVLFSQLKISQWRIVWGSRV
jgi:hypothetical protein